jgi:short-subunit dehydrogenase
MPHPSPGHPDGSPAAGTAAPDRHPDATARSLRGRRRQLAGLRAVVTGGSSGVGRGLALELCRRGVRVLATARREPRLAALVAEAGSLPGDPVLLHVAGDITAAAFRRELVAAAVERLGGLDIVVAAAGSGAIGSFRNADPETLRRIMEIDFFAAAELVRESLPALARGRDPAIVLVGSILGHHPLPLHAEYCAAKAALHSLAASLRQELAADGIGVLLASLGPTESEFWDHLLAGARPRWSRGRPLTAARTATCIADALERRCGGVIPGWRAKGFAIAARCFPGLIDAIVRRRFHREAVALHNQRR